MLNLNVDGNENVACEQGLLASFDERDNKGQLNLHSAVSSISYYTTNCKMNFYVITSVINPKHDIT